MYTANNQGQGQAPIQAMFHGQRFQTVNILNSGGVASVQIVNRPMMTATFSNPQQRQAEIHWRAVGPAFSGGDQKAIESAEKVKMKVLPFYEIKQNLIKQSCLQASRMIPGDPRTQKLARCETQLDFGLTVQQCALICSSREVVKSTNKIDYSYQLQLRFGVLNLTADQDDEFPPSLVVKVNGRQVSLPPLIPSNYPGTPPRQPSKPLNITSQAKLRPMGMVGSRSQPPNSIVISWQSDILQRNWVVSLNLVKKLSSNDLFQRLKDKGYMQPSVTGKLIESIMKVDEFEMAPTNLKVSVACPVGKSRMEHPCRSTACSHIQCFDALLYLQMNEKKPVWSCPVCNKKILYDDIAIDGFFVQVIKDLPSSACNDIEINADGSWKQIDTNAEKESEMKAANARCNTGTSSAGGGGNKNSADVEYISIDDDSDDEAYKPSSTSNNKSLPQKIIASTVNKEKANPTPPPAPATIETISLSDSDDEPCEPVTANSNESSNTPTPQPGTSKASQPPPPITETIRLPSSLVVTTTSKPPAAASKATPATLVRPPPPSRDEDDVICLSD